MKKPCCTKELWRRSLGITMGVATAVAIVGYIVLDCMLDVKLYRAHSKIAILYRLVPASVSSLSLFLLWLTSRDSIDLRRTRRLAMFTAIAAVVSFFIFLSIREVALDPPSISEVNALWDVAGLATATAFITCITITFGSVMVHEWYRH
jgi:hypothetical protein